MNTIQIVSDVSFLPACWSTQLYSKMHCVCMFYTVQIFTTLADGYHKIKRDLGNYVNNVAI